MIRRFKILGVLLLTSLSGVALAQSSAALSGIIESDAQLPDNTRVAVFQVDSRGVWGRELATAAPIAGTFSLTVSPDDIGSEGLLPFQAGSVRLPGLLSEYRVAPSNVNYTIGRVNVYLDDNQSGSFEREGDGFLVGISSLENPQGYYNLIYVDRDVSMITNDMTLELKQGWNIYTFRLATETTPARYAILNSVDDVLLNQFVAE
jgi:hypothetical protein